MAIATLLNVKKSSDESIYSARLWWWDPYTLFKNEHFTEIHEYGYIDRVAQLNLQQFVDMNRGQIEQQDKYFVLTHAEQIQHISTLIRSGEWDDATLHVTLYEWESGLS